MENNNKKFYAYAPVMKVGEVVVASLEGNQTKKDAEFRTVKINGEDRQVGQFTLAVNNKVQGRYDYAMGKYDKNTQYADACFIRVVGWGDQVVEAMKAVQEQGRKIEVFGTLTEKSYKGKEGDVFYLELTIANRDAIRGLKKKNGTGTPSEENPNLEGSGNGSNTPDGDDEIPF